MGKIIVIIPAYNEENNIAKVIDEIREKVSYVDILIVNDGSKDNTSKIVKSKGVCVLDLPFNLGVGTALQTGYIYAKNNSYDIAVHFDADGQHIPEEIHKLIDCLKKSKTDLVIGSRFLTKANRVNKPISPDKENFQTTFLRRCGIQILSSLLSKLVGKKIKDPTSGFRAAGLQAIKIFSREYPTEYPEAEEILLLYKKGYSFSEIGVSMRRREYGKSTIKGIGSFYYMIKVSLALLIESI